MPRCFPHQFLREKPRPSGRGGIAHGAGISLVEIRIAPLYWPCSMNLRSGGPKVTPVRDENVSPGEHLPAATRAAQAGASRQAGGLVRHRKSSRVELSGDNQAIFLGGLRAGTHRSVCCMCIVQPRRRNPLPSGRGAAKNSRAVYPH